MKEIPSSKISRTLELAAKADSVAIMTHMKPDGDALGSSIALYQFLKHFSFQLKQKCYNKISIILPSKYPSNLGFLTDEDSIRDIIIYESESVAASEAVSTADLIFCLDMNTFQRTEYLEKELLGSTAAKVLIDHHLHPDSDKFNVVFSEIGVSSASELLFHILKKFPQVGGDVSKLPASCSAALYTGMTTDTNNFNNSTYPSTLLMASELIGAGVDRDGIVEKVMHSFRENRLRLLGEMLSNRMTVTPEGAACMTLDKKTMVDFDMEEGDTEGFVNIPLDIAKVRLSVFLKEDEGRARVSVRSKRGTSANRCAVKYFRGGGHENASGGKLLIPEDIPDFSHAMDYAVKCVTDFLHDEDMRANPTSDEHSAN